MASVNKVIILGNLGKDPEVRYSADGSSTICSFTVATTESWKDKGSGEKKEVTEWHRVVFFGRTAEVAGQYLKKGRPVYVEGRLQTRKWQDKDGNDRWTTEIVGDRMQLLGGRDGGGAGDVAMPEDDGQDAPAAPTRGRAAAGAGGAAGGSSSASRTSSSVAELDDDIPF